MNTLWFIVPAKGRLQIAEVCLRQLRRTCDALEAKGILASAVVIADDENLELARQNDFATVERENVLGKRINDGYQAAGREGVEFMVPFGSDDWIDPEWIRLPNPGETIVTHLSTVVNEDCTKMAGLWIRFGDGVRVYSRRTLEQAKTPFRPADDDKGRAMDASTYSGTQAIAARVFHDTYPMCIVDFKSPENLNGYTGCVLHYKGRNNETTEVWDSLAKVYPAEAIAEMRALHDRELVKV